MRRTYIRLSALLVLLLSILGPAYSNGGGEVHPNIRAAINALEAAKGNLSKLPKCDLCGHREATLDAIDKALTQLHLALECDPGTRRKRSGAAPDLLIPAPPVSPVRAAYAAGGDDNCYPYPRSFVTNFRKAFNSLGKASTELKDASHDYCGHRAAANQAVNNAMEQLSLCINCILGRVL